MTDEQTITAEQVESFNRQAAELIEDLINGQGMEGSHAASLCAHVSGQLVAIMADASRLSTADRGDLIQSLVRILENAGRWQNPKAN